MTNLSVTSQGLTCLGLNFCPESRKSMSSPVTCLILFSFLKISPLHLFLFLSRALLHLKVSRCHLLSVMATSGEQRQVSVSVSAENTGKILFQWSWRCWLDSRATWESPGRALVRFELVQRGIKPETGSGEGAQVFGDRDRETGDRR